MRPLTLRRLLLQCSILVLILFVVVVIAVKFGAVPVSLYALGRDLWHVLLGQRADLSSDYVLIIKNIRLPRILLGIIVGASLSVAGTSFQALLRNPLADPYVLGVSMGASLGSILALIADTHLSISPALAALLTPLGAFLGAILISMIQSGLILIGVPGYFYIGVLGFVLVVTAFINNYFARRIRVMR